MSSDKQEKSHKLLKIQIFSRSLQNLLRIKLEFWDKSDSWWPFDVFQNLQSIWPSSCDFGKSFMPIYLKLLSWFWWIWEMIPNDWPKIFIERMQREFSYIGWILWVCVKLKFWLLVVGFMSSEKIFCLLKTIISEIIYDEFGDQLSKKKFRVKKHFKIYSLEIFKEKFLSIRMMV